jgi:HAD superfamily hydrolase (TIGR01548 family)
MKDSEALTQYVSSDAVLVRPATLPRLAVVDTLIFDVDGVITDVTRSIRMVGCDAVRVYLTRLLGWPDGDPFVEPPEIELYKLADGFNDDWEIAGINVLTYLVKAELTGSKELATLRRTAPTIADLAQAARQSRRGVPFVRQMLLGLLDASARERALSQWDYRKIVQVFQELYAGEDHCFDFYGYHPQYVHAPGRIALDRPLIRRDSLPPALTKLGVYSGRTWEETRAALEMAGIRDLFTRERVIVVDDGIVKPDPRGIAVLVQRLDSTAAVYVGDMPDDREAVRRYRQARAGRGAEIFDCLVLSGPMGGRGDDEIRAAGADIIAPDVNAFMEWWARKFRACRPAPRQETPASPP